MSSYTPVSLISASSVPPDLDRVRGKVLTVPSQDRLAYPPLPDVDKRSSTPPEEPAALKRLAGSMTFGPFQLVPSRQLLLEGDRPVRLGSRAYELLLALVEHRGELLSKEDLIRRVWPETFVEEANLRVHIAALRKALGDGHAGNRYLSNIPGRGYRFVAAVHYTPEFPDATAAPEADVGNLPAPLTRMLGRAEAIMTLAASLGRHRIVSVIGPGGIGKTTVAIVLAGYEAQRFTDGVCFVDLGSLPAPDLVPAAIGTALGLAISAADPTPALLAHLRHRRMLLILDGCETFPDRAAAIVEQLAASTAASVLVTSREPLRAEGEHVYRLPALDVPQSTVTLTATQALQFSAIQLFVERAGAASDGFRLTDQDAPAAIEICRRLDGIPLAVELAAGRIDAFGVGGLAALLDDRFRLMMRGRRTALPRHQTLAATLDWSYNALGEVERRVLRRLGTFSGSFDLDAAAAVASDANIGRELVIDTLADLVSKSLLTADVSASIAMYRLGETTRSYARLKLSEAGELDRMRSCLGAYLRDTFDAVEHEWNRPTVSRLALHRSRLDDVRAALDWAFAPGGDVVIGIDLTASVIPLWMHLSLMDECQQRTERAIAALGRLVGVRPRREMKLYGALGLALMFTRGAVKRTVESLTRSHDIAANLGEVEYSMRALWGLWVDRLNNGAVEDSLALARRFIEIAKESRRQVEAAIGERMLGFSLHFLGRQVEAQAQLERMLSFDPGDDRSTHPRRFQFDQWCTARATYSEVLWLRGFADRAVAQAVSSVAEAEEIGHVLTLCNTLAKSCAVALLAGDCQTGAAMVGRLREHSHVHALPFWQTEAECLGAVMTLKSGNLAGGIELMRHHLRGFPGSTLTVRYVAYLGKFADALSRNGEFEEADAAMSEALSRANAAAGHWWMPELLRVQGEVMLRRDCESASRAGGLFRRAMALAAEQGALGWELRVAMSVMRHAAALRCEDEAREQLVAVYARLTEGFDTQDVKEAAALLDQ